MKVVKENELLFAKMKPNAIIPTKKNEDAGYDLYACFEDDYFVIDPGETKPIPTGIAVAFSPKYYIQIEERSSMAKNGIKKSGGVMDSGYRGEYLVLTYNTNKKPFIISKIDLKLVPETVLINGKEYKTKESILYPSKKAVCEFVVQEIPVMDEKEVSYEELLSYESARGAGGFGSSGK